MIVVIDNYDSFTYNLVDLIRRISAEVTVVRNDEVSIEEIEKLSPMGIVISPGPGRPEDGGISLAVARHFKGKVPILGVCLGHQVMGSLLGMEITRGLRPMHGKTSLIRHDGTGIFAGISQPMQVMRYHSLVIHNNPIPDGLEITAVTEEGEIMGIRHKLYKFAGVQFHPESILTREGDRILKNWMESLLN